MKMKDWRKPWILFAAVYFFIVTAYVVQKFPQAEAIPHQPGFYKKLSKKSAGIIWPATYEDASVLGIDIPDRYKQTEESELPDYVLKAIWWKNLKAALKDRQDPNIENFKEVKSTWLQYRELIKNTPGKDKSDEGMFQIIEMPNKHEIKFLSTSAPMDILGACQEYWQVVGQETKEKGLHLLFYAFLSWIIPCMLLYGSGLIYQSVQKRSDKKKDFE